jgi:ankyrin repeat protein
MTELMKSAHSCDMAKMETLVKGGADLNATDLIGKTALFWAAESGVLKCFRWLLDHGATPQAMSADGCTPLHSAAIGGNSEIVRSLLGGIVDLNKANVSGRTALGLAVLHRHIDVARTLLRAGADPAAELGMDICHEAGLWFGADHPVTAEICGRARSI